MSNRTSHRRRARHQRNLEVRANVAVRRVCDRTCESQCDDCHDLDNCVQATRQYGDLLLCEGCRSKYPAKQPWLIDAESGEVL